MNSLWKRLLVVSMLLATATVACAGPPAEKVEPTQPRSTAPGSVSDGQAAGGNVLNEGLANASAPELIKVSSLEPGVGRSAAVAAEDRQLELRRTDFLKFAEKKLKDMNRNHILSRERMRIEKRPDGSYQASFHQLDDRTLSYEVSRSPSKGAQYVAVLSYQERIYRASCASPAACRQGDFAPVEVIPNRHIFVYTNGVWQ